MLIDGRAALIAIAAIGVGLLACAALLWQGGEMHFRNCLASAEARYPTGYSPERDGLSAGSGFSIGPVARSKRERWDSEDFAFYQRRRRDAALAGCSRWP